MGASTATRKRKSKDKSNQKQAKGIKEVVSKKLGLKTTVPGPFDYMKDEKKTLAYNLEGKDRKFYGKEASKLTNDEIKEHIKEMIALQSKQYGQVIPSGDELENIIQRLMSNQEEISRISDQLMTKKMLDFFKEKAPLSPKKVTFDAFLKQAYGKA